jgi:predicted permease
VSRSDGIRRAFRLPGGRGSVERDVDEEIRFHIDTRVDELVRAGMGSAAAEAQALREFGDVARSRQELTAIDHRLAVRRSRGEWWSDVLQDAAYALRTLRRQPAFAAVILLTLALGIGANTAIFSIADAALLRPLPYDDPEGLVHLWQTYGAGQVARSEASYPDFVDWRAQTRAFAGLEGYDPTNVTVVGGEGATMMDGGRVTSGFFDLLGVRPMLGRAFVADEDRPGGARVVVLSYEYWLRHLGGDPQAVGRAISVNGQPHTVVGVLPRGFHFSPIGPADLWLPLDASAEQRAERFNHWVNVVARLGDGVSIEAAQADLASVMSRLVREYPETNAGRGVLVFPLRDEMVGDVRPVLLALLGAVGLVLLIACANVASLLLSRAMARGREMAVRSALGAGRSRLVRQLVTESLVLAVAGGALGVWVARLGVRVVLAAFPSNVLDDMTYLRDVSVDGRMLAFTALVALVTGIAFGLAPALHAARPNTSDLLRHGNRATTMGRPRLRDVLVTTEIALTVVLLVGTGLLARSIVELLRIDPGFDAEQVLVLRVALSGPAYDSALAQQRFFEQLMERARSQPGVREVGAASHVPLSGGGANTFRVEGQPEPDPARRPEATLRGVAGDYFTAMRIPLIEGRVLSARDDERSPYAIVIDETLARRHFPVRSPVGERLRFYAFPDSSWEVVGVVGDVRSVHLDVHTPTIYTSHLQAAENRMSVAVRTIGDPAALAGAVRREVRALDPSLPVYGVSTMEQQITNAPAISARRYPLVLIGAFAAAALVLAVVGIYGVIAFGVTQRTRELGIRIALGARSADIIRLVLQHGALLALTGISLGTVVALALSRSLSSVLYRVPTTDPITYLAVAMLLAAVTVAATLIPARRATRVDPADVLRAD